MKTIEIKGHLREATGGKPTKELRREGHVPCVVYGGEKNIHFYADERELMKLVYTKDVYRIKFDLDGTSVEVVLRETQYHPVKDNIMHMDFVEVVVGKQVSITLPVLLNGSSVGIRNGGVLRRNAKKVFVRGRIEDIPEAIQIDISNMNIGESIKVGDLNIRGIEILEAANRVVVAVKTSRRAIAEEEEEEEGEEGEGEEGAEEGAEGSGEGGESKSEASAEAKAEE